MQKLHQYAGTSEQKVRLKVFLSTVLPAAYKHNFCPDKSPTYPIDFEDFKQSTWPINQTCVKMIHALLVPPCYGPVECSDNGYCIYGTCYCFVGYEGISCQIKSPS